MAKKNIWLGVNVFNYSQFSTIFEYYHFKYSYSNTKTHRDKNERYRETTFFTYHLFSVFNFFLDNIIQYIKYHNMQSQNRNSSMIIKFENWQTQMNLEYGKFCLQS